MESGRREALVSALTTEHYTLQSAAGTAASEGGARATAFILTVSSSMVAIGFTVGSDWAFRPFVAAVLPVLFGLGVVTTVRLVETGVQGLMYQRAIARIRTFYRSLDADHAIYFGKYSDHDEPTEATEALAMIAARRRPEIFSVATTTALITSGIGGIGLAVVLVWVWGPGSLPIAYCVGAAVLAGLMAAFFVFERRRYREVLGP